MTAKQLGDRLDTHIIITAEPGFRMGSLRNPNRVWIHNKFLPYFDGRLRILPYWRRRQAIYLFWLFHEMGHNVDEEPYNPIRSEDFANHWAAKHYLVMVRKVGFKPEDALKLWRALPDHYREA